MTRKEKQGFTRGTAASWVAFGVSTLGLPWVPRWVWVVDTTLTGSRRKGLDVSRRSWACLTPATPWSCSCLHVLGFVLNVSTRTLDPLVGADQSITAPMWESNSTMKTPVISSAVEGFAFHGSLGSKWPNGPWPACSHGDISWLAEQAAFRVHRWSCRREKGAARA